MEAFNGQSSIIEPFGCEDQLTFLGEMCEELITDAWPSADPDQVRRAIEIMRPVVRGFAGRARIDMAKVKETGAELRRILTG